MSNPNPMIGEYCIIRTWSAGVHAGTIVEVIEGGGQGSSVLLENSRRLWSWQAKAGVALSGVAQNGIVATESKVDSLNPRHYITGVIELIPATDAARESIENA